MRTLVVRNLSSDLLEGLRQRAKANNRSLEAEARVLIHAAVFGEKRLMTRAEWEAEEAEEIRTAQMRQAAAE